MEKKYGRFNVDVAGALNNLALLYGDRGRDADAELFDKRAIASTKRFAAWTLRKKRGANIG